MNPVSNTRGNTPTDLERQFMRDEHGIGWHVKGGWCRKFPGDKNRTYFGHVSIADAVEAHKEEERRRARGLAAEASLSNLMLKDAANLFLTHQDHLHARGDIGTEQRASYGQEIAELIDAVGGTIRISEFAGMNAPENLFNPLRARAIVRGLAAAEKHIVQVRTFLNWCSNVRRYSPAPFYADTFNAPGKKEKDATRKADRREKGQAYWQPAEVLEIVAAARATDVHRYAQILLMLNGAMGSTDLSDLQDADIDWERHCIHTDRSKTLVPRVVPLWTSTEEAMRASRTARAKPAAKEWASRFFLTAKGKPLVHKTLGKKSESTRGTDSVKNWFYVLMNGEPRTRWKTPAIRLPHLKRHRAGGYTLRSVFATLSTGCADPNLVAIIMGHQFPDPITGFYLRDEQRAKLVGIVQHVHSQLWPNGQ